MTIDNFMTLGMLILLQAVLGIDNLLYISLESKNAPPEKQALVRKLGIGLAIFLRIGLLFALVKLTELFQDPFWHLETSFIEFSMSVHTVIIYVGGGFIIYTAMKEIWHMISLEDHTTPNEEKKQQSLGKIITLIVVMNVVFSADSILSAMALTKVMWVMVVAIIIGGVIMIWLAEKVSAFLQKNRMYEVLGLFILFLVGIMLLTEAGHLSHLKLFGSEITAMNKTTFYFIIGILVIIDVVQGKYQKKLTKEKQQKAALQNPYLADAVEQKNKKKEANKNE